MRITAVVLVTLVVAAAAFGQTAEQAKQVFQQANDLAAKQDFYGATVKYEEAIRLDPTLVDAYSGLAKIQDAAQAEQTLIRAVNANPRNGRAYGELAGYYNRLRQFDKTIETYRQWADVLPQDPEPRYTIAAFYRDKAYRDKTLSVDEKRGCVAKGLQFVDEALALKPEYVEALVSKGLLLRLQASFDTDKAKYDDLMRQATELTQRAQEIQKRKKQSPQ